MHAQRTPWTQRTQRTLQTQRASQSGYLVVEALIAILIFSIGILGLVGLQTRAVTASTDAQVRVQAALLAEELIGKMWATDRSQATLQAQFDSTIANVGAGYNAWAWQGYDAANPGTQTVAGAARGTVLGSLPMVGGIQSPVVTVTPVSTATALSGTVTNSLVTITLQWKTDPAGVVHKYVTTAQIGG